MVFFFILKVPLTMMPSLATISTLFFLFSDKSFERVVCILLSLFPHLSLTLNDRSLASGGLSFGQSTTNSIQTLHTFKILSCWTSLLHWVQLITYFSSAISIPLSSLCTSCISLGPCGGFSSLSLKDWHFLQLPPRRLSF